MGKKTGGNGQYEMNDQLWTGQVERNRDQTITGRAAKRKRLNEKRTLVKSSFINKWK
jgi:hypothetical protein